MNAKPELQSMSPKQLNILRHSIGYDDAGNDRWNGAAVDSRRNRFVTDESSPDGKVCLALCELGLMTNYGAQGLAGGMSYFAVTEAGRDMVRLHAPVPKKMTRSQLRYRKFLRSELDMSFGDWLKSKYANPLLYP